MGGCNAYPWNDTLIFNSKFLRAWLFLKLLIILKIFTDQLPAVIFFFRIYRMILSLEFSYHEDSDQDGIINSLPLLYLKIF